jgi:hypothetical protein
VDYGRDITGAIENRHGVLIQVNEIRSVISVAESSRLQVYPSFLNQWMKATAVFVVIQHLVS